MEAGRKGGRGREREGEGTDKWREGEMGEGKEGRREGPNHAG